MSKLGNLGAQLYQGKVSIDFVGRRKTWYVASGRDRAGRARRRCCSAG